jgi:predicted metal-dependent enzyme (double-stranded beta helix superfamily)
MSTYNLDSFVNECRDVMSLDGDPVDRVELLVPAMYRLLNGDTGFLKPEHFKSDPDHYARNAIHIEEDDSFSLYALVWSPGQWTPIHDHGTWGVVGVYEGALYEKYRTGTWRYHCLGTGRGYQFCSESGSYPPHGKSRSGETYRFVTFIR